MADYSASGVYIGSKDQLTLSSRPSIRHQRRGTDRSTGRDTDRG